MHSARPTRLLVLAAMLAAATAGAAAAELAPLSEGEMSQVYGQGLTQPVLGALGARELSGSEASATAADVQAATGLLGADGNRNLDRQFSLQTLQGAAQGAQLTFRTAQSLQATTAVLGAVTLPVLPMAGLFGMPSLGNLQTLLNNANKH